MVSHEIIETYFPDLSAKQKDQFEKIYPFYCKWNAQINVISRKDTEELYIRHVLHSLSIAKIVSFENCKKVLDIGTGGGFPGIPLAILYPKTQFHLIDSIAKKIKVVDSISNELGLTNVFTKACRVEAITDKFDLVMSRAVARLSELYSWSHQLLLPVAKFICLKGGDLEEEIKEFRTKFPKKKIEVFELKTYFKEAFFETKKLLIVH